MPTSITHSSGCNNRLVWFMRNPFLSRFVTLPVLAEKSPKHSVQLKLVASPQSPVVEIATGLCLFQELPRIEDPVVGLKPHVTVCLPANLCAGPMPDESCYAPTRSSDQESGH